VWLILLFVGTFCIWDNLLIPVWKGGLLGDSAHWVVLQSIIAGLCLILTAPLFYWQSSYIYIYIYIYAVSCLSPLKESQCYLWSLIFLHLTAFLAAPMEMLQWFGPFEQMFRSLFSQLSCYVISIYTIMIWHPYQLYSVMSASCMRDWWQSQTSFEVFRGCSEP
jgi:hypothetical protein